jgi:hypothetical protein
MNTASKFVLATCIACGGSVASAATFEWVPLGDPTGTALDNYYGYSQTNKLFGPTSTLGSSFSDTVTFKLSGNGPTYVPQGFLNNVVGSFGGFLSSGITGVTLTKIGTGLLTDADLSANGYNFSALSPGDYEFTVFGTKPNDSSYRFLGSISVTPVPEPETYAMLLAGLGLMGAIARRRKQNAA